ncbi:MAG: class A beta-lactamase [Acidobacteriota bacterium]|nr:class A beta-lactamase [Acidobacteriota bacterium]MDE3264618.1 class A beta-lactamase [Acidobacteriota bacterium]
MSRLHSSRLCLPVFLLVGTIVALAATPVSASERLEILGDDPNLKHLGSEIERLAEASLGTVGVAAIHLESGRGVLLNGNERFPMASTYKVPIAVEILAQVDEGQRSLDDLITIQTSDHVVTYGALSDFFDTPGSRLTIQNVLGLMLRISDNIATDLLFREAGGAEAITARMRASGAEGIRVDRTTRALIASFLGRDDATAVRPMPPAEYNRLILEGNSSQLDEARLAELNEAFNSDPRDTATPQAMAALLRKIWKREILSEESSALLIDIMARCETGENRIPGALPPNTPVAHKTGTIGESTNDVGVITLPGDAGHVISVVFVKESKLPSSEAMEPVIAEIARASHDYFVFNRD